MKSGRSAWVLRVALAVTGALFFALAVAVKYESHAIVIDHGAMAIGLDSLRATFPLLLLWFLPLLAGALLILKEPTWLGVIGRITRRRSHLIAALLSALLFLITLVPQKHDGQVMITYLSLASVGFVFLSYGLYPLLRYTDRFLRPMGKYILLRVPTRVFLLGAAGVFFAVTNLISLLVFHHIPHIQDSIDQVFQARVLASGRFFLHPQHDNYFFNYFQIFNDGARLFGILPFGHSVLLMLGSLLRLEWMVNPLLGSLAVVVIYFLGKECHDETGGRVAALLGLLSPFMLFMSSEYMNHASCLLFISLFLLFFLRTINSSGIRNSMLAGLALGMALNIRPLTAFAVALPTAIYGIYQLTRRRNDLLRGFILMTLPIIAGLLLLLLYDYLTTGNPLASGYKVYYALEYHTFNWGLGFGTRGWSSWGEHTVLRGLIQTGNNLNALNKYLFESPLPGMLPVFLLFVTFPKKSIDYLLLAVLVSLPIAYFFYWFQDLCFGPRFLYESLGPILVLSGQGILRFPRFIGHASGLVTGPRDSADTGQYDEKTAANAGQAFRVMLFLAFCASLLIGIPHQTAVYADHYWGVNSRVYDRVRENRIRHALVFINPDVPSSGLVLQNYYGSGFLGNTLDFRGPVVYALDRGPDNYVLMKEYPGRQYYFAGYDTFRSIDTTEYRNTTAISDLLETSAVVESLPMTDYRSTIVPFRELGGLFAGGDPRIKTLREVSFEVFQHNRGFRTYLPALAVVSVSDSQDCLMMLSYMKELDSYIADEFKFTLLFKSANHLWGVYDIRPLTGKEMIRVPGTPSD